MISQLVSGIIGALPVGANAGFQGRGVGTRAVLGPGMAELHDLGSFYSFAMESTPVKRAPEGGDAAPAKRSRMAVACPCCKGAVTKKLQKMLQRELEDLRRRKGYAMRDLERLTDCVNSGRSQIERMVKPYQAKLDLHMEEKEVQASNVAQFAKREEELEALLSNMGAE